ncbi:hypothetical protein [Alcaligenes sp. YSL9]|uniref:hypothetical protein n=1 Tax=Alcaligenes sp. YSL9 TaxID=2939596 RepID=UPI00266D4340|nr:hypothetical protein [Alcaligenes sp. YSL9]
MSPPNQSENPGRKLFARQNHQNLIETDKLKNHNPAHKDNTDGQFAIIAKTIFKNNTRKTDFLKNNADSRKNKKSKKFVAKRIASREIKEPYGSLFFINQVILLLP